MSDTLMQVLMFLLTVGVGALGWFARVLYEATKELRKDLSELQVKVSEDYVRYDRMQDAIRPILDAIKELREDVKRMSK